MFKYKYNTKNHVFLVKKIKKAFILNRFFFLLELEADPKNYKWIVHRLGYINDFYSIKKAMIMYCLKTKSRSCSHGF